MKATDLLTMHHEEVESLFSQIEAARDARQKSALREELANKIVAHSVIEKEIFYPAVAEVIEDEQRSEAYEEHALVEFALMRFLNARPGDDMFEARAKVVKDLIQHHVEEEQDELFPKIESAMEDEQLEELGVELEAVFAECIEEGYEGFLREALAEEGVGAARPARKARRQAKRGAARARGSARGSSRAAAKRRSQGGTSTKGRGMTTPRKTPRAASSSGRKSSGGGARKASSGGARKGSRSASSRSRA